MSEVIRNRYDFVVFFDVECGNPNGDPDAGNMPRIDPETGHGLVTDVCLKRKIRNYVQMTKENDPNYQIYIQERAPLNRLDTDAAIAAGAVGDKTDTKKVAEELKKARKDNGDLDIILRDYMCKHFFDVRAFGAVMTTFVKASLNCGQVRGPVQLGFARSVDPIVPQEVTITRVAITTEEDFDRKGTEMGNKYIVPYGLYRCEGFVSANLAQKSTGFSEDDLQVLWDSIINMFEDDHSASRGKMAVRKLIVFKHESIYGNAPSWTIFETVSAKRIDPASPARSFKDYTVEIDEKAIPEGVICRQLI